ncbi:MAG: MraZ protein, partial [Dehalococcoidia bacterium]|nr:MraZ protein [Dehalococcoidia bacterium]
AVDRQGRIVLPQALRQYAGITDEVIMTGQDTYFEIWAPERWRDQEALAGELGNIAETLLRGTEPSERDNG